MTSSQVETATFRIYLKPVSNVYTKILQKYCYCLQRVQVLFEIITFMSEQKFTALWPHYKNVTAGFKFEYLR
jgi:hypothetical protein